MAPMPLTECVRERVREETSFPPCAVNWRFFYRQKMLVHCAGLLSSPHARCGTYR
jgi:hypothetical protein